MKVKLARVMGFCGNDNFGVVRSMKLVKETAEKYPGKTYCLGEVVHNQRVVDGLANKYGLKTVQKIEDVPKGSVVIIRAHGVGPQVYKKAERRSLTVIDATCPIVMTVHKQVKRLVEEGKKIIYIASEKTHDEAMGVHLEAPKQIKIVTLDELDELEIEDVENTVVITQTTLSLIELKDEFNRLKKRYPSLQLQKHVCMATTQRQEAVMELAGQVGMVIVVGSTTSSNSLRLKEVAEDSGVKAYLVNGADEVQESWFRGVTEVGLTAGASTPDWLVEEVKKKVESWGGEK